MIRLVTYLPIVTALCMVAYVLYRRGERRAGLLALVMIEFGTGVVSSLLRVELLDREFSAVARITEEVLLGFTGAAKGAWLPALFAFTGSCGIILLERVLTQNRDAHPVRLPSSKPRREA